MKGLHGLQEQEAQREQEQEEARSRLAREVEQVRSTRIVEQMSDIFEHVALHPQLGVPLLSA